MISLIEKLFFKKRVVFCTSNEPKQYSVSEEFSFQVIEDIKQIDHYPELRLSSVVKNRLISGNWILFVSINNKNNEITAYYWAVTGKNLNYWHDNFIVQPGTALLCNAFVKNEYRQQGLYKFLIYKSHEYLFQKNIQKVFTVVENSNTNSLKANRSAGLSVYYTNYLVKLFCFNVFSIFKKSSGVVMILFGSKLFKSIIYNQKLSDA